MDGASALRLLRQIALENGRKQEANDPDWTDLVYWLDPATHSG